MVRMLGVGIVIAAIVGGQAPQTPAPTFKVEVKY